MIIKGLSPSHNDSSLVLQDIILFEVLRRLRSQGSKYDLARAPLDGVALVHVVLIVNDISACVSDTVGTTAAQVADSNLGIKRILDLNKVTT